MEKFTEAESWVTGAKESNTRVEDKMEGKQRVPEACILWVATRVEIQCLTSHNH